MSCWHLLSALNDSKSQWGYAGQYICTVYGQNRLYLKCIVLYWARAHLLCLSTSFRVSTLRGNSPWVIWSSSVLPPSNWYKHWAQSTDKCQGLDGLGLLERMYCRHCSTYHLAQSHVNFRRLVLQDLSQRSVNWSYRLIKMWIGDMNLGLQMPSFKSWRYPLRSALSDV